MMNVALWAVQLTLAIMFMMAGSMKLMKDKEELAEKMGWVEDFSQSTIRLIGAAEIMGAIGLILPALTGIAPILTPLAASGLAVVTAGAMVVHLRRREYPLALMTMMLAAMAAFVAWGRFGPEAF
jgi:uncharacterized membrane protein YphA (DoxX/SURF4 family)